MTTPPADHLAVVREIAGLILALIGVAGLAVVMFTIDPRLGFSFLSVVAIVAGILLTTGRE